VACRRRRARALTSEQTASLTGLNPVLPCVLAKSTPHLGRLRFPLELIDLPTLPDRLTVHRVLKPFDHGFNMPKAFLQVLELLRYRWVLSAVVVWNARWRCTYAKSSRHTFKHPCECLHEAVSPPSAWCSWSASCDDLGSPPGGRIHSPHPERPHQPLPFDDLGDKGAASQDPCFVTVLPSHHRQTLKVARRRPLAGSRR
jgi:hypothetical protein